MHHIHCMITIFSQDYCYIALTIYCTQTGWTPLMKASRKGHVDIVRILINTKAQINTQEEVYTLQLHVMHCTTIE